MNIIKFSHSYKKLRACGSSEYVKLLGVVGVDLAKLDKPFLDYDTDNGKYKLPKSGVYMMLIFKGQHGIFTTLRSPYPRYKVKHYKGKVGEDFKVIIN